MTLQFSQCARRQHPTRERAERAIEVYDFPAGYLYEVVEHRTSCPPRTTFAVKVWSGAGDKFLGYAWDPREAVDCGEV
jgi:hypothetical protein